MLIEAANSAARLAALHPAHRHVSTRFNASVFSSGHNLSRYSVRTHPHPSLKPSWARGMRNLCAAASGSMDTPVPKQGKELEFFFSSRKQLGGSQLGCYDAIKLHDTCVLWIVSSGKKHKGEVLLSFFEDEGRSCDHSVWKQQLDTSQEPFGLSLTASANKDRKFNQMVWGTGDVLTIEACLAQLGVEIYFNTYGRAHQSQLVVSNTQYSSLLDAQGLSWNWLEPIYHSW